MMETDQIPALGMAAAVMLALKSVRQIDEFIDRLIEMRDGLTGDPDLEDATDAEDEGLSPQALGYDTAPGCAVADTGENAWIEWHRTHPATRDHCLTCGHEDAEEDDDSGQCDEDGINTRHDRALASGPGCKISDPGEDGGDTEPNGDEGDYGLDGS